jgi:hypothetical protein
VEVQDTPRNAAFFTSPGCVTPRVFHSVPFQCAAEAIVSLFESPTAVHELDDAQETESITPSDSGRLEVDWTAHSVPFQRSAKNGLPPPPVPTAVQAVVLVHDTPSKNSSPPRVGTVCVDQLDPFQDSAQGENELPLDPTPTAIQLVSLAQDTPASTVSTPVEFVVDWIDHSVPFHRSASVRNFPFSW